MNGKSLILLTLAAISGCSTPPQKTKEIEKACTNTIESPLVGKSFPVKFKDDSIGGYYRYNKSLFSKDPFSSTMPRLIQKNLIAGKTATVLCEEIISHPDGLNERVIAVRIDGISDAVFTSSQNEGLYLSSVDFSIKSNNNYLILKSFIGQKRWATPERRFYLTPVNKSAHDSYVDNIEELTINNVTASNESNLVRIFFKRKSNQVVYIDYDLTNGISEFDSDWHTKDPKIENKKWPAHIWKAIESGDVTLGMTTSMVSLSIGNPIDINTTTTHYGTDSQWVYKSVTGELNFYYFRNDTLKAIQD
ncbi:hypothetical protein ACWNG8_05845 [Aeromonas veronii]|uniref:hypothetical protein n=1 Tax=Aeromonas sp. QDB08 TaxID=2990480 RepID=UPI0022E8295D|nr:hypothetical protein [Aeromonas sp. QDB08]